MSKQSNTYTAAMDGQAVASAHETGTALISWATALALYNRLIGLATPGWMAEGLTLGSERELKLALAFLFVAVSALAMGGICDMTLAQEGGAL